MNTTVRQLTGCHVCDRDTVLIIAGHFTVDPLRRDEYVAAFADLVQRSRAAPGCLDVAVTADSVDPGRVYMYERWRSWHDVSAWREVANAPEIDVQIIHEEVAMWDANGQRSPFEEGPDAR